MNQTPLRRNRSYLALVSGYLATDFGSAMVVFTLPLVVAASGASATAAGAVGFAYAAGNAVCLLPAGVHVDRSDRRTVMVASSSAVSLLLGSLVLAVLWADLTFTHLFAVAALAGMANAYMAPAEASALRMLLPVEQLGSALSVNQARQMAASLLAAPIGGMLLVDSELTLFGVVTAAFAAAACAIALVRVRLVTNAEPRPRTRWAAMSAGTRWLLRHPTIRTLVLASAAVNMALAGFTVCLVLGLQAGGMHPAVIGLLNTAAATAGLCGALLSPRLVNRMRTGTVVLAQGAAMSLACLALPFVRSWLVIAVLLAASVLLLPAANAATIGYQMTAVPPALQGRVAGSTAFLTAISRPLGPLAAGVLLQSYGARVALLAFAAVITAATTALVVNRSVRTIPEPGGWAPHGRLPSR